MGMDIKPPMSQGTTVAPDYQNPIDAGHDKKSGEQEGSASAENAQVASNTVLAMKQAGNVTKASMKTRENLLQQALADKLGRNAPQFAAPPNVGGVQQRPRSGGRSVRINCN